MAKIQVVLLLTIVGCVIAAPADDGTVKIKYGELVDIPNEYLVNLNIKTAKGTELCGGALIRKNWILTAAHCLSRRKGLKVTAHFNSLSLYKGYPETVSKIIVHGNWTGTGTYLNDIALLKLEQDIPAQVAIPVTLAQGSISTNYDGQEATIYGWGQTENGFLSTKQRKGEVTIVDNGKCKYRLVKDSQICANIDEGAPVACTGDSGGPVFIKNSQGNTELIGIVSFGSSILQGPCTTYDIYTKVAAYTEWITTTLAANN